MFWEGQDDIKFLRWKENVDILVDKLSILSESLTFRVVQLLREKIDPSAEVYIYKSLLLNMQDFA